jgi:hypothetical protein
MAQIVFGMAVPHSGMLGQAPEEWLTNGERDRQNPELWFRNRTWTYPELEAARAHEGLEALLTLEERTARAKRCRDALEEMHQAYLRAKADVVIILGKDQKEIFTDMTPSLAIYSGAEIHNGPPQRGVYAPDHPVTHPGHPELARHLLNSLQADGFDMTDLMNWPANSWMKPPPEKPVVPHAYGFVYRQIMRDHVPPNVPILMNTFYAPTQPSMTRALAFGEALVKAIKTWDSGKRVALIASGGLTHFVFDPELDKLFIDALGSYDFDALKAVDERSYQAGTSEVKLYCAVLVAMKESGTKMTLVDYLPCVRTPAGTGEGMAFMYWAPANEGE